MERFLSTRVWVVAVALVCGIVGEALLFVRHQCFQIESYLLEDFRIVIFVSDSISENALKILGDRLQAMPMLEQVRYVSAQASLEKLEGNHSTLKQAVLLLGRNPVLPSFEVKVSADALGSLADWLPGIRMIPEVQDVRYKALQADAILQVRFYERFVGLATSLCLSVVLIASVVLLWRMAAWPARPGPAVATYFQEALPWILSGIGATLLGMGFCFLIAYPIRYLSPFWVWPPFPQQLVLAGTGGLWGWIIFWSHKK
ncbi:MAG: hypothetical protein HY400_04485 [Elusimicrobia bacterium]|nr:hypothetical protein [Elusimicrobiota bacterium]